MPLADMMDQRIRRLVPHEGLVVDVDTWESAHGYHAIQQRLHSMSLHNDGIVTGLEVVAWDPADNSVVINPGVAIDADGHMILVAEPQRFQLQTGEAGTVYLILQYREVPGGRTGTDSDGSAPRFVIEAYRLEERRDLPTEPFLELARIQVSGTGAPITDAQAVVNPGVNEISLQGRAISGPRRVATVRIGVVPLEMDSEGRIVNSSGVMNLIQAIKNSTHYGAEFKGSVNLGHEITECDLIFLTGQQEFTLADEWMLVLRNFVDGGGVIMGEGSRTGMASRTDNPPFRNSFLQLAEKLNREFTTVERGHALLSSHFVFAQAPEGVDGQALLVAADGMVYTDNDYGALWDGGRAESPATREQIRAATELGINVAVHAVNRVKMRSARLAAR